VKLITRCVFTQIFNYGNEYLNIETRHYSYYTHFKYGDQRTPQQPICTNQIRLD